MESGFMPRTTPEVAELRQLAHVHPPKRRVGCATPRLHIGTRHQTTRAWVRCARLASAWDIRTVRRTPTLVTESA